MSDKLKIGDTVEGTFGKMTLIEDFLPPPNELIFKKEPEKVKVTLTLEKRSVDFFKKEADKLGGSYQRMMRNLLSDYADKFTRSNPQK